MLRVVPGLTDARNKLFSFAQYHWRQGKKYYYRPLKCCQRSCSEYCTEKRKGDHRDLHYTAYDKSADQFKVVEYACPEKRMLAFKVKGVYKLAEAQYGEGHCPADNRLAAGVKKDTSDSKGKKRKSAYQTAFGKHTYDHVPVKYALFG